MCGRQASPPPGGMGPVAGPVAPPEGMVDPPRPPCGRADARNVMYTMVSCALPPPVGAWPYVHNGFVTTTHSCDRLALRT